MVLLLPTTKGPLLSFYQDEFFLPAVESDYGSQLRYDQWLEQNQKSPDEVLLGVFNGRYGRIWLVFDSNAKYLDYFK